MTAGNNGGVPGRGAGFEVINKFGVNFDIDTGSTPETIWAHGGVFPFIDAGIAMDLVSSHAADDISGTGAQKARITYYTSDNTEVIVDKDLAGLFANDLADIGQALIARIKREETTLYPLYQVVY